MTPVDVEMQNGPKSAKCCFAGRGLRAPATPTPITSEAPTSSAKIVRLRIRSPSTLVARLTATRGVFGEGLVVPALRCAGPLRGLHALRPALLGIQLELLPRLGQGWVDRGEGGPVLHRFH